MRLAAAAAVIEHELPRGLLRDLVAIVFRDHRQRQIDAGRYAGRGPDVAIAHEDAVGLELHLRIGFQKMPRPLPVRGGAPAVEQAGFREDVGAGTDAGDPDAALRHGAHEVERLRQVAACRTPSPPATIRVVIAPADFNPRATISTPEDERTGPGVTASTLIEGAFSAKRAAISNTEIGPAASSNWKSGNTRTPIMLLARFCLMS